MTDFSRRNFLKILGAGTVAGSFPAILNAATGTPHVVVIGGGFAGATAAKYLRHWSGKVNVTLVEPNAQYHSPIMSNLVLNNSLSLDEITFNYNQLRDQYGVNIVQDWVDGIDATAHKVHLAGGSFLEYDRCIVAPGIDFIDVPGLDFNKVPHAWKAGSQTLLLRQQLAAMSPGSDFVMTIPAAPYRCPPGPYERACVVADYLRKNKPGSRVIVLDANPGIIAEKKTFGEAFETTYGDILEYIPNAPVESVDSDQKMVVTGMGDYQGGVLNVIPNQRAGKIILDSGLANSGSNHWAGVNPLSYESTAVSDVHVIGDSQGTGQPKAGHIANAEAKVCADAVLRLLDGNQPYATPVTNSACYSPITATTASWLTAAFAYDPASGTMKVVPGSSGEASSHTSKNYRRMFQWSDNLFADTFT